VRLSAFARFAAAVILAGAVATSAAAQTVTWTIDPGHSAAQFTVRHMVVSNVRGEFDGPTGTVTFDPTDLRTLKVDPGIDVDDFGRKGFLWERVG